MVKTLISGDLCELEINPDIPFELCKAIASSTSSDGIIGLIGYISAFIRTTKDMYDYSDYTFLDQYNSLNLEIGSNAEIGTFFFLFPAYGTLE